MIRQWQAQRGISITAVLGIMLALTILALTFLGMVRFQIKDTAFEQATITAAYIAEMGFQQVRAELVETNGEWSLLDGIVNACETTDPFAARCQRIPASNNFADFRVVRENPLDPSSPIIGIYEVGIETGQKRAVFGNRTLTGATTGYVPGSVLPAEQVGYDIHGNQLCDNSNPDEECPGNFLGVRVKAWLTDAEGNLIPNTRSQTVYGVLQMSSLNPNDDGPSSFMLESHEDIVVASNSEWNNSTGLFEPQGGFYGPMHTNGKFTFQWDSSADDPDLPGNVDIVQRRTFHSLRHNAASFINYRDELGLLRPFWGVLMAHRNNVSASNDTYADLCTPRLLSPPKMYSVGTNFQHLPFFKIAEIRWAASPPAVGSTYQVVFRRTRDGQEQTVNVVRGHLGAGAQSDVVTNPFNVPFEHAGIVDIRQGGSSFPPASVNVWVNGTTDWVHFDGTNWVLTTGTNKPTDNYHYCVRYIDHSTINIHEQMTYAGAAPDYRYWHEHPAGESMFSLNQAAHGHTDVMGAELAANSISGDPGYDGGTWRHSHSIVNSADMFGSTLSSGGNTIPNTFIKLSNGSYAPSLTTGHVVPLLMPTADLDQYKNQMEQLNKYLVLTLGVTLPRDATDTIDGSALGAAPFNASNYAQGYLVGKFPASTTHGSVITNKLTPAIRTAQPIVDFRATYFGNDLRYSAGASAGQRVLPEGSAIDTTAYIWVNDNPESSDYMKVAASAISGDYRHYLYRQIPPGKVIVARDAVVLIGNMRPQTANCEFLNASCLDYHPGHVAQQPGRATIVNGQLSIVSFTTTVAPAPPSPYSHYNLGDIVVTGNVLYHNDFYAVPSDKTQMRQLGTQPVSPYTRSKVVSGPITNIDDPAVMWITNTDGTRSRNASGSFIGTLDGLGLFAVNDIKLSVTGYFHSLAHEKNKGNAGETLRVHGQLVAGKQIAVHRDNRSLASEHERYSSIIDKLEIFGTVYSYRSPDFSSYFKVRREYYFDRSLKMNPLVGAPYYPESEYAYRDQTVYSQFPRLVQGTWTQSLD
ncbi:MAG: hypothetical protein IGS03_02970 [Candidatus Sericytochromatia bacterium]|nr:hypothetical protein [Candidatus Sericytochromatia bacterium]